MSPKLNDSLKVTSFTLLSWCCMLLLLAVCHCCLTTATYLCINLPNWSSTDGKEYGGLSWGCVNTLWPQYLSWNSGVLIFHLVLIFFFYTYISLQKPAQQTSLQTVTPAWVSFEVICRQCCSSTTNTHMTQTISQHWRNWDRDIILVYWVWKMLQ